MFHIQPRAQHRLIVYLLYYTTYLSKTTVTSAIFFYWYFNFKLQVFGIGWLSVHTVVGSTRRRSTGIIWRFATVSTSWPVGHPAFRALQRCTWISPVTTRSLSSKSSRAAGHIRRRASRHYRMPGAVSAWTLELYAWGRHQRVWHDLTKRWVLA